MGDHMKVHFSSMYIQKTIKSFEEIANDFPLDKIELILDTNLCILLRDFYREPQKIVERTDGTWEELKKLLFIIEHYDLEVDYSIGAEESCRNLSDFELNYSKLFEMREHISSLFSMDYFEMIKHSTKIKNIEPVKNSTSKTRTKIASLEKESTFQNLLYVGYTCLLKLFLLRKRQGEKPNVQLMIEYIDFMDKELDCISLSHLLFGYCYLSGKLTKLIHSNNVVENKIHAFWNAAIDLTLPALIGRRLIKNNKLPIFVTGDERLWTIFDAMKVRALITDLPNLVAPPAIETDMSIGNWSDDDFITLDKYLTIVQRKRLSKQLNKTEVINRSKNLCIDLEKEVITLLDSKNLP